MKKILILAIAGTVLVAACGSAPESPGPVPDQTEVVSDPAIPHETPADRFRREIGDSQGVVVLSDAYGQEDFVRIYDKGGALWYEFSYYDESAFDELESINTDFRPFSFHPDYLLLAMRVVSEDTALYEVVVNEEKDLRKFVRKDDQNLAYEPFEEHLLTVYAVDFDPKENPLRQTPGGEPLEGDFSKVPIFKPASVDGDWLEVAFRLPGTSDVNANRTGNDGEMSGWVRWRDGGLMTVTLFYVP